MTQCNLDTPLSIYYENGIRNSVTITEEDIMLFQWIFVFRCIGLHTADSKRQHNIYMHYSNQFHNKDQFSLVILYCIDHDIHVTCGVQGEH